MVKMIKIVRVKRIIDGLLQFLIADYTNNANEQDTFLYNLLHGSFDGDYNFYEQAKGIFYATDENPRKIKTALGFAVSATSAPQIHIRETVKSKGSYNSIGTSNGDYFEPSSGGIGVEEKRATKKVMYDIVITSMNHLETILIAEVIDSLLLAANETLTEEFDIWSTDMKDIMFSDEAATNIFGKAITLETEHENTVNSIITSEQVGDINFILSKLDNTPIIP